MGAPTQRKRGREEEEEEEEEERCRLCLGGEEDGDGPLLQLCACRGSARGLSTGTPAASPPPGGVPPRSGRVTLYVRVSRDSALRVQPKNAAENRKIAEHTYTLKHHKQTGRDGPGVYNRCNANAPLRKHFPEFLAGYSEYL